MGRILIIRGGALGDFILTLPVLAALRAQFPRVGVEVLGYPHIAKLALIGGLADRVHPIEARALAGYFSTAGPTDDTMAEFFDGFALIISFLYDPDAIFHTNVARVSRAQFIAGPHRPNPRADRHAVDTFLEPLRQLAIFDAEVRPRLQPTRIDPGPGRWIAAHPGSGSETKNWPEWCWAGLLRRILEHTDHNVLLVGGEAEGERLEHLARDLPEARVRIVRSRPLDEVAGRLRGCCHFIGHDSGITHLAASVGLPCVVLWGPSELNHWRPRGEDILVLQDDAGLAGLAIDSVWETLRGRLARRGAHPSASPLSVEPPRP